VHPGTGTLIFTGFPPKIVSLAQEAEKLSVAELVALRDADLRKWMAERIMPTFLWTNLLTLVAIGVLFIIDEFNVVRNIGTPRDRIITSQVIMALLGATTVQIGTIAVVIARYLFPGRRT
jgi:hypothetical protein